MPQYIYKFGLDQYCEWTTVADGPTTAFMTRDEMATFLFNRYAHADPDYHEIDRRKMEERLVRADTNNTSDMTVSEPVSLDELIIMWVIHHGPRDDVCPTCNEDMDGPCPVPGHMWTLDDFMKMMTEARA